MSGLSTDAVPHSYKQLGHLWTLVRGTNQYTSTNVFKYSLTTSTPRNMGGQNF